MKGKLSFIALFALASAAYAAGQQPTAVYTFTCNGNAFLFQGTCPEASSVEQ